MGDRYNPLYELGAGAFGKAWLVRDNKTQKKCVSKVIQIKGLSSVALDRCVTEVAVLSACSHVNIVRYIEAFVSGGALHILMEYASGGDLQQKIEKQNGIFFTNDQILDWFLQVIMALEYIHSINILHRDLKPQNIFLMETGVVKLGDFGIARVLNNCDDLASTRIGTPFYISPEICQRKPYNSSSDMWAAGCLLYQICLLRVPFQANNFDDLTQKIVTAEYDPVPSHFSPAIRFIITSLLAKAPSNRLSASQLLKLESVHGMVLYLRHRNSVKGPASRSRSSSLVNDRSRTHQGQTTRSNSAGRQQKHSLQNGDVVKPPKCQFNEKKEKILNNDCRASQRNNVSVTEKSQIEDRILNSRDKSYKQMENICESEKQIHFITDSHARDGSGKEKIEFKGKKGENQNLQCNKEVEECDALKSDFVEQCGSKAVTNRSEQHSSSKLRINSRTFTIKDSVAKQLSEASPRLSLTVRKQRFSLSISEEEKPEKLNISQENQDEVFQSPVPHCKERVNCQTYLLKNNVESDANNNCKKSNSDNDEGRCSETGSCDLNYVMLQALSVLKFNKELSENILLKEMRKRLGKERCDQIMRGIDQFVLEGGQNYSCLSNSLTDCERNLIPLICMYLAC